MVQENPLVDRIDILQQFVVSSAMIESLARQIELKDREIESLKKNDKLLSEQYMKMQEIGEKFRSENIQLKNDLEQKKSKK